MPDPLPRHEHRHRAVELEPHHLARRGVPVPAEVADQAARLRRLPRAVAVGNARRALDRVVASHVVDQRDEAVVEDGEIAAQDLLGGGDGRALGFHGWILRAVAGTGKLAGRLGLTPSAGSERATEGPRTLAPKR